jgi:hypothetical protein
MQGEKRENWEKLCQMAADEKDPERLMDLVEKINRLLEEKEKRLQTQRQG